MDRPRLLTRSTTAGAVRPDRRARLRADPARAAPTGAGSAASSRRRSSSLIGLLAKLGSLAKFGARLRRVRRLRADLGLAVRARRRPADLRPRDGPLARGQARGAEPVVAGLHPVPRRLRQAHARQPVADGAGRDRGADPRRRRRARLLRRREGADGSDLLLALAYFGFVLNLFNLLPIGILDGGAVWRSTRWLWLGGGPREGARLGRCSSPARRRCSCVGAFAAYVPQHRL